MGTDEIHLFTPGQIGPCMLKNRIAMSAMTRCRAGVGNIPQDMNVTYYTQRASAGLIITEAAQVSPQGIGYMSTPGIYTPDQVKGWKAVTDAVHEKGGIIFIQLFHCGRISHPLLQEKSELPVAPSAVKPEGEVYTPEGKLPFEIPRALETEEIPGIVNQFRTATEYAKQAGFDGVEIYAANGYLPHQFLEDGTNQRTDHYGGPVENRARFLLEIVEAVTGVWEANRVGIHLSPSNPFNSIHDSNPEELYTYLTHELNRFNLAYLNIVEIDLSDPGTNEMANYNAALNHVTYEIRKIFTGPYITNGGYDLETGNAVLEAGDADIVSYGRHLLANPDLAERFVSKAPLNSPDPDTFYLGGEKGYIDYPFM
ncbi:MAG: alkene reductase [Nitrospiraceae bacterium]|nr:MAG: alkene reductase [Nitrospiraceae bacterium]